MNIDIVLSKLGKIRHGSRTFLTGERLLPLHSMPTSCGWQVRRAEDNYDWHGLKRGKLEFALIQYTIAGWGLLEYEGSMMKVEPGDAMLLHFPHRNRYWLPPESESWEFVYLCLNGRELVRLWREMALINGPLTKLNPESEPVDILCEIYSRAMDGLLESPFDMSSLSYQLAMSLLKTLASRQGKPAEAERPEAVKKALAFCQERLGDPSIGVKEIAAAAGLSRHHFSRLFEASQGVSPAACLKGLRLKEAARLLQMERLSVKEVADACGFGDSSYFCRVFRECFGISPEGFRRSGMFGPR